MFTRGSRVRALSRLLARGRAAKQDLYHRRLMSWRVGFFFSSERGEWLLGTGEPSEAKRGRRENAAAEQARRQRTGRPVSRRERKGVEVART